MNKRFYLGQDFMEEDWGYGLGSVYLGGSRNPKGKSWRLEIMKKFEETKTPMSFFIPETKNQLKGGFNKVPKETIFQWEHMAISVATVILFWYPSGSIKPQSCSEFGAWHKNERIFYGRESNTEYKYFDWLLYKEHKLYPAENIDQLVEMVTHWMRE